MKSDIFEGKWKQMRGQMKKWWGELTDDDIDVIAGNKDILLGKLQEKYGYAKEKAEEEIERRLREWKTTEKEIGRPAGSKPSY